MAEEFIVPKDGSDSVQSKRERIKHVLIGSPRTVQGTINKLHLLDYVERHNWSKFVSAGAFGEPDEVMTVLIRYPVFE